MALAVRREPMAVGMARSPPRAARLEQGTTARDAIRQATLLAPGKQPGWLTAAVEEAERGLSAQPAEPPADPPTSEDAG
jgi:hypothetical protein